MECDESSANPGVGLVHSLSSLLPWLSFWGSIATIVAVFIFRYAWAYKNCAHRPMRAIRRHYLWYGSSFLTIIEVVFMKDILISGEWYRANTVFKVSTQV